MGIPSYFKTLTEKIPGCLQSTPGGNATPMYLLFDFNCLVYFCLRMMRPYTEEGRLQWEADLCTEVEKVLVVVWENAGKPPNVFIGVDGVVPMAKIKQQRMRRFKSVWWGAQEVAYGVRAADEETWDKNAITPGTAFMERLGERLQIFAGKRKWTVSTSNEPGEGEHKVMGYLRNGWIQEPGSIVIYGLDADLIVLSMLTSSYWLDEKKNPCFLMREKAEFGRIEKRFEDSTFLFLSVNKLLESICWKVADTRDFITNYVAVMSILGNDFLPHGLTLKIRDGGHEKMLGILREMYGAGSRFVENGKLVWATFQGLFQKLALSEAGVFEASAKKKRGVRHPAARSETEAKMIPVQILPLEWYVEKEFFQGDRLRKDWESVYERYVPYEDSIREWKYGAQWILDYYLGKPINTFWFYPWHLPPLWGWLAEDTSDNAMTVFLEEKEPIQPMVQLALVLPMESWWLVRDKILQRAPLVYPHMWPSQFGFATLGKWWMWECEADIPILLPRQLQENNLK